MILNTVSIKCRLQTADWVENADYNPEQNSLGHLRKLSLLVQVFKVRWHYLFFETPLPATINVDR